MLIKLYKIINDELHYWEIWDTDKKTGIIHWGMVGGTGEKDEIQSVSAIQFKEIAQQEINKRMVEGYKEIPLKEHQRLLIEYAIDGMGNKDDLDKRYKVQEIMNNILGWTGLGHCDGGSIGNGTMEICCYVVNFKFAKIVTEIALSEDEFKNYTKIYES